MKKLFTLTAAFLLLPLLANAQTLQKADELFQQEKYADALKEYQQLAANTKGDTLYKVQLRQIACQYNLGQYTAAATDAYALTLPPGNLWRARFLLYRIATAKMAKQLTQNSGYSVREVHRMGRGFVSTRTQTQEPQEGALSAQDWQDRISNDYEALWSQRQDLANDPLSNETLIMQTKNTNLTQMPTLLDFVVNEWEQELTSFNQAVPLLKAADFLTVNYKTPAEIRNNIEKLASIYQTAADLNGHDRANAKIYWQVQRILLPFNYADQFEESDANASRVQAVQLLNELSGYSKPKKSFFGKIKGFILPQKADYGRAYAAARSAEMLNVMQDYVEAVKVCTYAEQNLGDNDYTRQCRELSQNIQAPVAELQEGPSLQNPSAAQLKLHVRNVNQVYVRLYRTDEAQLKKLRLQEVNTVNSWDYLSQISTKNVAFFTDEQTPSAQLTAPVSYLKKHAPRDISVNLPKLQTGFYAVLISYDRSFDAKKAPVYAAVLNAGELLVAVTAGIDANPALYAPSLNGKAKTLKTPLFRVYTFNAQTGLPEGEAELKMMTNWEGDVERAKTDENGLLSVLRPIKINAAGNNSYQLNPLATKNGNYAYTQRSSYFYFYQNEPVKLFLDTDRAIYRPGQTVQFSVNGFEQAGLGLKTLPSGTVNIKIRDANYTAVYTATLKLNAFGSAKDSYALPANLLLGQYSLNASFKANGREYNAYASFQVDDYKRPDYELTLQDAKTTPQYGKAFTVEGFANYYYGAPVQKAEVTYTVERVLFMPRFWWWFPPVAQVSKTVASGSAQTDDKGKFTLSFTPEEDAGQTLPTRYLIKASVMDESGRKIDASKTYQIGKKPAYIQAEFAQGFYDAHTAASLADVKLTDLNAVPVDGKVTAEIYRLEGVRQKTTQEGYDYSPGTTLQNLFVQNKEVAKVHTQELEFKKDAYKHALNLPALPEGVYKLTLKSAMAEAVNLVFLVASEDCALDLPSVALWQFPTYYPGNTAKALLGGADVKGPKYVEAYIQNNFLARSVQLPAGVSVYKLPVNETLRGGVGLQWFAASDYQFHRAQSSFEVPFDNKELSLKITAPETVKPGQKVTISLLAKDATGSGVQGQASLNVYDKSLDYYAAKRLPFSLSGLYPQRTQSGSMTDSFFQSSSTLWQDLPVTDFEVDSLPLPKLDLQPLFRQYRGVMRAAGAPQALMTKQANFAVAESDMAVEESFDAAPMAAPKADTGSASANEAGQTPVEIRTDFAESAYYNPLLPLNGGKASAAFTMPQSLTAWNIVAYAITRNADYGSHTAQLITRKDFTIRLQLPRFYREGDKGVISAQVSNLTNQKIQANVELTLLMNDVNSAAQFGVTPVKKTVAVAANGSSVVTWDVTVPQGVGVLSLTAVARAGTQSDGEQKMLPVLPSRQRLLATSNIALQDGLNTLTLTELQDADASRRVESAVLQIDPSLILSAVNAMPKLLAPIYKDVASVTDRYVPLAVLNSLYQANPALKKALSNLPKRSAAKPAWDETDPLRQTLLSQTPWLQASQGQANAAQTASEIFNPSFVAKQQQSMEKLLVKYQNANGSYSWLPGGPGSRYLTLYVLNAYAEAVRFNAPVPQKSAEKAMSYLTKEIDDSLKADAQPDAGTVAYALYAAHVLSAFPANWKAAQAAKPYVKAWAEYADEYSRFLTPLGLSYSASIWHRLGDNVKAQNYLQLLLSRVKTNPLTGAYFAPEADSWLWYNDTLTTQTAALRAVLELDPKNPAAAQLVQWLLFNRKAQTWDGTTAAAQAVYALADYMKQNGLMSSSSFYNVQWGPQKESLTFEPFAWSDKLRYVQTSENVQPQYFTATVEKKGGLTAFASLSAVYETAQAKASAKGVLNVSRGYFLKTLVNGQTQLKPLGDAAEAKVGDEVEVHLTVTADSAFDYVLLQDPKPAGFESDELLSGWTWGSLPTYRENKDGVTNFFLNAVPAGTYTLKYTLRPTLPGKYNVPPATIQSMYAPEFGAHTAASGWTIK